MHGITKTAAVIGVIALGVLSVWWFLGAHSVPTTVDLPQPKATEELFTRSDGININSNKIEERMPSFPRPAVASISEEDLDRFLKIATPKPDVIVKCISFDPDGVELAKKIESIFSRNGFHVNVSQITPRFVNYGLSAAVPADPSDTNLVNAVWKLFDHLHSDGSVYVGMGHTNLAIEFGMGRR